MNIDEYVDTKIEFQNLFLNYLDDENEEDCDLLINFLKIHNISKNKDEIRCLFHFINIISSNHHRCPNFFQKIENIISFFINQDDFKKLFTNLELIELFWDNKTILLFLYENKIIFFNEYDIYQRWLESNNKNIHKLVYFYPEIKIINNDIIMLEKLSEFLPQTMDNFEEKRKIGENAN